METKLLSQLLFFISCFAHFGRCFKFVKLVPSNSALFAVDPRRALTLSDVPSLTSKACFQAVCGDSVLTPKDKLIPNVDIITAPPLVSNYIIANPKVFLEKPEIAVLYGFDVKSFASSTPLEKLALELPIIYIADIHPEYGTLGFMLNKLSPSSMMNLHPTLKSLRSRPIYKGGLQNKGSTFTMLHTKIGFPENRSFKKLPDNKDSRLFYSPDIAMANELCLTKDAVSTDFKFMEYCTIWLPRQLDVEYNDKLWLTLSAPVAAIFEDEDSSFPLWRRFISSLPPQRLRTR